MLQLLQQGLRGGIQVQDDASLFFTCRGLAALLRVRPRRSTGLCTGLKQVARSRWSPALAEHASACFPHLGAQMTFLAAPRLQRKRRRKAANSALPRPRRVDISRLETNREAMRSTTGPSPPSLLLPPSKRTLHRADGQPI